MVGRFPTEGYRLASGKIVQDSGATVKSDVSDFIITLSPVQ